MSVDPSAHELQAERLHALIGRLSDQLAPDTVRLADEMEDANEARIALDMVSEMLVEREARVAVEVFDEIRDLAAGLGLDPGVTASLKPLIED